MAVLRCKGLVLQDGEVIIWVEWLSSTGTSRPANSQLHYKSHKLRHILVVISLQHLQWYNRLTPRLM